MTPPALPSLGAAVLAVFRLQWVRLVRGKKLRLGAVAVVLVVLTAIAGRYAQPGTDPVAAMNEAKGLGFFTFLAYLVPFLLSSGAIAEEVESRTFTYLAARPVGRLAITLGKYLAAVAMSAALLVGGLLVLHVACFVTEATPMVDEIVPTARAAGALLLLALLYGAVCAFWGALVPEAGGIVATLHLFVVEFAFGALPGVFRFVSMNYHATQLAGLPKMFIRPDLVPDVEPWGPLAAIVAQVLLFLAFASLTVGSSEYRFGKA